MHDDYVEREEKGQTDEFFEEYNDRYKNQQNYTPAYIAPEL